MLLAAALWIASNRLKTRWTALAAMLSYAMPNLGTYGWFGFTIMAMRSAVLFALLGVFQVFGEMEEEKRRLLAERSTGQSRVCEQLMIGRG